VRGDEWIASFAERIDGEPPSEQEIEGILRLAATAAHASERTAAPVACWLAGRSGSSLSELERIAEEV
jgi:hypothetical protein